MKIKTLKILVFFWAALSITSAQWTFSPEPVHAAPPQTVEKDTDNDGKIDRIIHFDARGRAVQFDIDTNADEIMDRFQYYEKQALVRAERDSDYDGKIDGIDYFKNNKRVRLDRINKKGRIHQTIHFDEEERPLKVEKDTTDDGEFDLRYFYEAGALKSSTRDTDADGKTNIWIEFKNDKPTEKKSDNDGDGRIEQLVWFDEEGLPRESRHDFNADEKMEVFRYYQKGEIVQEKKDDDQDDRFDVITDFVAAQPEKQKKDSNLDGRFDVFTKFSQGKPATQEKDTNFDDTLDQFITFDANGDIKEIREDSRYSGILTVSGILKMPVQYVWTMTRMGTGFWKPFPILKNPGSVSRPSMKIKTNPRMYGSILMTGKKKRKSKAIQTIMGKRTPISTTWVGSWPGWKRMKTRTVPLT